MDIACTLDQCIQDVLFLRNWSRRTADTYRNAIEPFCPADITTKASLNAMVIPDTRNASAVVNVRDVRN
jgi:hypothetical protein